MSNWWEDEELEGALSEAEKDDRVGDHTIMVKLVEPKTWDDGRTSYNCTCEIETAGFSQMYANFSDPSSAADLKQAKEMASDSDARRRVKAMAYNTRTAVILAKEYGLENVADIGTGFRFAAKLVKNKKGYIAIASLLPKARMAGETPNPTEDIPF